MMLPKPTPKPKIRKPMNRIGPVGKRRLAANKTRPEINHCEIGPILKQRGITFVRCMGELQFCHARKVHRRRKDAVVGTPEHEETWARGCSLHHESYLDLLPPDITCDIVMTAIKRRVKCEDI